MQPHLPLQPPPETEVTLRTMAELLRGTDRLCLVEPGDGAVEVVEILYAVRDIIDSLGAETSRCAAYLTSVEDPAIDMMRVLSEALQTAGLLARQTAATVSDAIDAGPRHDD